MFWSKFHCDSWINVICAFIMFLSPELCKVSLAKLRKPWNTSASLLLVSLWFDNSLSRPESTVFCDYSFVSEKDTKDQPEEVLRVRLWGHPPVQSGQMTPGTAVLQHRECCQSVELTWTRVSTDYWWFMCHLDWLSNWHLLSLCVWGSKLQPPIPWLLFLCGQPFPSINSVNWLGAQVDSETVSTLEVSG